MPEAPIGAPERIASHIVTSENRAEFMAKRLDLAAPLPPAEKPAAETPAATSAAEPAKAAEAPPTADKPVEEAAKLEADLKAEEAKARPDEKKKQTIRERLSEINEKKKAAEAELAKEKEARAAAEKRATEAEERAKRAAEPPPAPEAPKQPQRAEFATEEEYQDARVDYRVKIARTEERKAEAEARARTEGERVVQTYSERLRAVKAEITDYDQRIEPVKDMAIPPYIRDSIFESEVGPRLPLYFADHPEEARRIIALSPTAALRELGKIEAMIESEAKPAERPKLEIVPPRPAVSGAPAPITPIKASGLGESEPKLDAQGRFTGTFAEWKAFRKSGKIK